MFKPFSYKGKKIMTVFSYFSMPGSGIGMVLCQSHLWELIYSTLLIYDNTDKKEQ